MCWTKHSKEIKESTEAVSYKHVTGNMQHQRLNIDLRALTLYWHAMLQHMNTVIFTTQSGIQETHIIACEKVQEHFQRLCPVNKTHFFFFFFLSKGCQINSSSKWKKMTRHEENESTEIKTVQIEELVITEELQFLFSDKQKLYLKMFYE